MFFGPTPALARRVGSVVGLVVLSTVAAWWLGFTAPPASAAPPKDPAAAADAKTPYGEMNLAWTNPGMIGLVGWAKDPDVDRPIDVVVGITDGGLYRRTAGVYNPFLPGKYSQKFRSYLIAIPTTPGPHTMCVAALNVGKGNAFRLLGCQSFVVAGADPIGNLEGVTPDPSGDGVRADGWALDPESSAPIAVGITVDGVTRSNISAGASRPDVGAFFPGLGAAHGFSVRVDASPGRHRVCAIGRNVGLGADATVGCRDIDVPVVNPIGYLDTVTVVASGIRVTGWASDLEAASISVRVADAVDGSAADPVTVTAPASGIRTDVTAKMGRGPAVGFDVTVPVSVAGTHTLCVDAINVGMGRDQRLGCSAVAIADRRPAAALEGVAVSGSTARLIGWAVDRVSSAPVTIRLSVDGQVSTRSTGVSRPDVPVHIPGARSDAGFDLSVPGLSPGRHSICVTFVGSTTPVAGAVVGDLVLPCSTAVVGATGFGTTGAVVGGRSVGPGVGPLADVDRDAGVSVGLRDGSVLWLFGDTVGYDSAGNMRSFVSGTGAWAPASQPAVTRDAVAPGDVPYLLASPVAGSPGCSAAMPNQVMWPVSAVTVPAGAQDRVIVYLANMCLADAMHFEFKGIAVGEWYYDPANPPDHRPVQLTITNPQMGMSRNWGIASVVGGDGFVYVYQCDRPSNPADLGSYGPCRVARVSPDAVAVPSAYRYWNGSAWLDTDPNVSMAMPLGNAPAGYQYPASSLSVVRDPGTGTYVMVYSPWPGFVDRMAVRVSRTPYGPWTEPAEVTLPGCSEWVRGQYTSCYAATAQPAFSAPGLLGVGYYDQAVLPNRRGRYFVAQLPFTVAP